VLKAPEIVTKLEKELDDWAAEVESEEKIVPKHWNACIEEFADLTEYKEILDIMNSIFYGTQEGMDGEELMQEPHMVRVVYTYIQQYHYPGLSRNFKLFELVKKQVLSQIPVWLKEMKDNYIVANCEMENNTEPLDEEEVCDEDENEPENKSFYRDLLEKSPLPDWETLVYLSKIEGRRFRVTYNVKAYSDRGERPVQHVKFYIDGIYSGKLVTPTLREAKEKFSRKVCHYLYRDDTYIRKMKYAVQEVISDTEFEGKGDREEVSLVEASRVDEDVGNDKEKPKKIANNRNRAKMTPEQKAKANRKTLERRKRRLQQAKNV
jgi:hypothetical protein